MFSRRCHTLVMVVFLAITSVLFTTSQLLAQVPENQIELSEKIRDAKWSPDGSLIAIAGENGVSVYTSSLQELFHSQDYADIFSVTWNPDGTQFASGGKDGTIKIWNYNVHASTFNLGVTIPVNAGGRFYLPVSWSPDGAKLASVEVYQPEGCLCAEGLIKIWNTNDWTLTTTFSEPIVWPLIQLVWNADSTALAGADNTCDHSQFDCSDSYVYIADLISGKINRVEAASAHSAITSLDWASNDDLAVAGSTLLIYSDTTHQLIRDWDVDGEYMNISWNNDHSKIVVGNGPGLVNIIDVASGSSLLTFTLSEISTVDWSPDGNKIVIVGGQTISVWDVSELPDALGTPTATYFPSS